jgi:two-component system nitrogen regulation sensor histidine kinase NtrY
VFYAYLLFRDQSKKINNLQNQVLNIVNLTIVVPLIISLIYAILFFRVSFSSIFNNNILRVLNDSSKVAETYYDEYKTKVLADAISLSETIHNNAPDVLTDRNVLKNLLETYASLKELSDAIIFIPSKNLILAKNEFSFSLNFDYISNSVIESAGINKPVLIENLGSNKIRAIVELDHFSYPTYLLIGKYMDDKVVKYIADTKDAMSSYNVLTKKIHDLQNIFLIIFIAMLVLLTFTSKFIAKFLTRKLVTPINSFVSATQTIANGDLTVQLIQKTSIAELDYLIDSFNRMTNEIDKSRREIISRGNFIEAIIRQIPDGLILFDESKKIILQNQFSISVVNSLDEDRKREFFEKIESFLNRENFNEEFTVSVDALSLLLKITIVNFDDNKINYLITFSDITEHLAYQKSLLWIEVAKRITHEIRNPLTPIILSAERLEDRYLGMLDDERDIEIFLKYINNIKRHTNDISMIIDEFIQFGKMPKAVIEKNDIVSIIQNAINSGNFDNNIDYIFTKNVEMLIVDCDESQINRALLNIFKNSYEAMSDIENKEINIDLKYIGGILILKINDNGPGFPEELLDKITEPYVSTKVKGSGLGLAIVKRIFDDHNWKMVVTNDENGHGLVKIEFVVS